MSGSTVKRLVGKAGRTTDRWYVRLSPENFTRVIAAVIGVIILSMVSFGFLMGLALGASSTPAEVASAVSDVSQVEVNVWADIGEGNALVRSVWGLFHWLGALTVWAGILGIRLGAALPEWSYPAVRLLMDAWPLILGAYTAVLLARLFELAKGKDVVDRSGPA